MARRPLSMFVCATAAALAVACGDVTPLSPRERAQQVEELAPATTSAVAQTERAPRPLLGPPYPIILVHGFSGFTDLGPLDYFFDVADTLREAGADVTAPALPPYNTPQERARVLADVIDATIARTERAKVHLIAHSQGGLDSRVVITELGYANRVASFTTISTPHAGCEVADLADDAPEGVLNPAGQFMAWLLGAAEGEPPDDAAWANEENSDAWDPDLAASVTGLSTSAVRAMRARLPIPASVPFFTVAGVSNLRSLDNADCAASLWPRSDRVDDTDPFFLATGSYLSFVDGGDLSSPTPNDGLVTVRSARDPQSTFLGCVPADHLDEVGLMADLGTHLVSGFDHRDLFLALLENARSVE